MVERHCGKEKGANVAPFSFPQCLSTISPNVAEVIKHVKDSTCTDIDGTSTKMEAVITLVMKYCGTELELYGKCVGEHPKDWQTACAELKEAAANCSDHHPVVRQINRDCVAEFSNYDACLKKNPEDVTVCVDQLHKFLQCADSSAHRIQNAVLEKSEKDGSHSL